jgi:hypothetical protein
MGDMAALYLSGFHLWTKPCITPPSS